MSISSKKILMFGSPWSAPAWMKTDHNMTSNGTLIGQPGGQYYETWAKYFVKFLDAYASYNISFWGLTAQNEPTDGRIPRFPFQSMGWYPEQQRDFIAMDLGPALEKNGYKDIKLMILDDQRILLPYWADKVLSSSEASKYISGIAVHWYLDKISPTDCLDFTHKNHPDKFIFGTEACFDGILKVSLGDWSRAEEYAHDIIQDLNHWVTGWTDWNIALNMEGGPNWVKNFVDSPIIVNSDKDEFYKQPMFYALGHFSKFIQPEAKRISLQLNQENKDLEIVGLLNPDNSVVIIVLNRSNNRVVFNIHDDKLGYIHSESDPHSIGALPCVKRDFGKGSFVCVCNASYCDKVEPNTQLHKGIFSVYTSSKDGDRLTKQLGKITMNATYKVIATINRNIKYQKIIGFGGAFTDAAGINIASLSIEAQKKLIASYYSTDGIEYSVGRIPMASCDFSTHPYSYDDTPKDFNLTKFTLAMEDLKYKIPYVTLANSMRGGNNLTLFGSPWSAPAWMKTNQNMTGKGTLIGQPGGQYFKTWALYFVRFLQEYAKNNIDIWGITCQNEPMDGNIPNFKFQAMGWTPELQRDFISQDLGPLLESHGFGHVKVMILDDTRLLLPHWAEVGDATANKYVSGIAVHWYEDFIAPVISLTSTHEKFPDKFILATEACDGSMPWDLNKVSLGDWGRAEHYIHDILEDLNHWVTGWTDWNIALNMEGGPNWVKNFVDSPIIVNSDKDEFYKQPMFYALGHFSKFLLPGSIRIENQLNVKLEIEMITFTRPDNSTVVIIYNSSNNEEFLSIYDAAVDIKYLMPSTCDEDNLILLPVDEQKWMFEIFFKNLKISLYCDITIYGGLF
ncbi:hypothetical protein KUTeg_017640, partial [Tegillarca granosa]